MLKNHLFSYIALAVLEKSLKNNFFGDNFENSTYGGAHVEIEVHSSNPPKSNRLFRGDMIEFRTTMTTMTAVTRITTKTTVTTVTAIYI